MYLGRRMVRFLHPSLVAVSSFLSFFLLLACQSAYYSLCYSDCAGAHDLCAVVSSNYNEVGDTRRQRDIRHPGSQPAICCITSAAEDAIEGIAGPQDRHFSIPARSDLVAQGKGVGPARRRSKSVEITV